MTYLQLVVTIDGTPTGGSPYPVFFSPPETAENLEGGPMATVDQTAAALGDVSGAATGNSLAATAQEVARMLQPDLARISAASDAAAAAMVAQANSMVSWPDLDIITTRICMCQAMQADSLRVSRREV